MASINVQSQAIRRSVKTIFSFLEILPSLKKTSASLSTNSVISNNLFISPLTQPAMINQATSATQAVPKMTPPICYPCTYHDREDMIDFLTTHFINREPLMRSMGATAATARPYLEYCIDEALVQKASFLARERETGELCGLRMNAIGPAKSHERESDFGPEMNPVPKFLHYMEGDVPQFLKTTRYMRHVAICVEANATRSGVATQLMQESVKFARKEGLQKLTAMCSWELPFKLATKVGFEKVREVPYSEYAEKQRLAGDTFEPFVKLAETAVAARLMVKTLE